jgi:integrase
VGQRDRGGERKKRLVPQGLGAYSINRSGTLLSRLLDEAIEYGHITANPAQGSGVGSNVPKPTRTWLELHEAQAVLEAAGDHRALIATMMLGGLRVGELIAIRWRDADLAGGTLAVAESKTHAGVRMVDMSPMLREELTLHRANSKYTAPDDLVFCTGRGTPHLRGNIRRRIVGGAVERANAALIKAGRQPIAGGITNHSLRRTFASLLYEAGATPAYVMAQMGHMSSALALEVYAKKMARSRDTGERMDALIRAADWAQKGANGSEAVAQFTPEETETPV